MLDQIIIAGGWSVKDYNLRDIEKRGKVIAVNDAAIYTKCDVAFTMDRLWLEGRQGMLKILNPPEVWYRKGTPKNFVPPDRWRSYRHSENAPAAMAQDREFLNGSNSGTCALNLAYQRAIGRVFLLGFDMQRGDKGEKHWYPDYPWAADPKGGTKMGTYNDWIREFDIIAKQFTAARIQVYNVNHRSLIKAFPVISFQKFLFETTDRE